MTVLGIMQPYFFPYAGHFQLIAAVDRWVVFDIVKYNRKSWMNRNRVLRPDGGWQYVGVPVHAPHGTPIAEARVVDGPAAERRILGQLAHYRGRAPFFRQVCGLVSEAFATTDGDRLRDLNIRSLAVTCDYLGLPFAWSVCSALALDLPPVDHAGRWALEISSALRADRYVNPSAGRALFEPRDWESRGVALRFLEPRPYAYDCGPYRFEPDLSILDALMWNDPAAVRDHLCGTLTVTA